MTAPAKRSWHRLAGWPLKAAALGAALVALLAGLGAARSAKAKSEMLALGADMLRVPDSAGRSDRVLFNGAELRVRRGSTPRPVGELLAAEESSCKTPLRGGDEGRGFVACGAREGDDSGALPVDYTYAERRGQTTHFIALHGGQGVDLREMFPSDEDAPGRDPDGLPRPSTSRRLLSLRVVDQPYEVAIYVDGQRGVDALVNHYQETLPGAGWTVVAGWRVDEGPGPRQASVVVERAGVLALLLVAQDRPATTTTTFLTMEATREQ
jgi:hypothetical protein